MSAKPANWSGNFTYSAARVHMPSTVDEVRKIVRSCENVRALGTRHSFNAIADCNEDLVSLVRLERSVEIDATRRTVTVDAGAPYGRLCGYLNQAGFALHNLASLPHISIAGACATATHGSGDGNACLASAVSALEMVTADGELVTLSREADGDEFNGVVVGLGGLGIVTKLTLDLSPGFAVSQRVYEALPLADVESNYDALVASGYSVSLFTDWRSREFSQVWVKRRAGDDSPDAASGLFGDRAAAGNRHPIASMSAENCTEQMGLAGAWHDRLPHFRMEFTPSCGKELQSEYLVPRKFARDAIRAIDSVRDQVAPVLQISELRTIAADALWMSPFYRQPCIGLHFTWVDDWPAVERVLAVVEQALSHLEARPHWGKLFTLSPERIRSLYVRLPDFQRLLGRYDPEGKFRNSFLDEYIGAARA